MAKSCAGPIRARDLACLTAAWEKEMGDPFKQQCVFLYKYVAKCLVPWRLASACRRRCRRACRSYEVDRVQQLPMDCRWPLGRHAHAFEGQVGAWTQVGRRNGQAITFEEIAIYDADEVVDIGVVPANVCDMLSRTVQEAPNIAQELHRLEAWRRFERYLDARLPGVLRVRVEGGPRGALILEPVSFVVGLTAWHGTSFESGLRILAEGARPCRATRRGDFKDGLGALLWVCRVASMAAGWGHHTPLEQVVEGGRGFFIRTLVQFAVPPSLEHMGAIDSVLPLPVVGVQLSLIDAKDLEHTFVEARHVGRITSPVSAPKRRRLNISDVSATAAPISSTALPTAAPTASTFAPTSSTFAPTSSDVTSA